MGFGAFSVVYLSYDYIEKDFYALKISKGSKYDIEVAEDEIKLLATIQTEFCCRLHNNFTYKSIFGEHIILVFSVYGETLFNIIRLYYYNGIPIQTIKPICLSILHALEYIHETSKLINTDIKPENILIKMPNRSIRKIIRNYKIPDIKEGIKLINRNPLTMSKSQRKRYKKVRYKKEVICNDDYSSEDEEEFQNRISNVVLSDFGNACLIDKKNSDTICTRQYRPPENILDNTYDISADIWSFGCCVYEFLVGELLFDPTIFDTGDKREMNDDHLASIIEITGGDPLIYKDSKEYDEYFRRNGEMRFIKNLRNVSLYKKIKYTTKINDEECKEWCDFILFILKFDYHKRPTAKQILKKYKTMVREV